MPRRQRSLALQQAAYQSHPEAQDGQDRAYQGRRHVAPTAGDNSATQESAECVGDV